MKKINKNKRKFLRHSIEILPPISHNYKIPSTERRFTSNQSIIKFIIHIYCPDGRFNRIVFTSFTQTAPKIFLSLVLSSSSDSPLYIYSLSITGSSLLSARDSLFFANMTNQQQKIILFEIFFLSFHAKKTAISSPLTAASLYLPQTP